MIDYTYDPAGKVLTEAKHYTLTNEPGATVYLAVTEHAYDLCGNETLTREPITPDDPATPGVNEGVWLAKHKTYDRAGRLKKTWVEGVSLGGGETTTVVIEELTYDPAGRKASSKAPYGSGKPWEGTMTYYRYDGLGRDLYQVTELGEDDAVTRHVWGLKKVADGNAVTTHTVFTPEGSETLTWTDQKGREIIKVAQPDTSQARVTYKRIEESLGGIRIEKAYGPAAGMLTTVWFDAAGRETAATDAAGALTEKLYNERGQVVREEEKIDDATTGALIYEYDALGRETTTYKAALQQGEPVDPTEYHYNAYNVLGQKVEEWDAGTDTPALHTVYNYNQLDQLTCETRPMTSDGGVVTSIVKRYQRDLAGRVTSLTLANDASPIQQTTYNSLGMVLSVISSPGLGYADIENLYTWDAGGRMLSEEDGEGSVWAYDYNAQGLLSVTRDPLYGDPESESYHFATYLTYDKEGRLTEKTVRNDATPTPEVASYLALAYNAFGEVTHKAFSLPDQEDPATETYTYQAQTGRLTSVACSNGIALSYADFDLASRPRALTYAIPGIGAKVETLTYKAGGSLASLTLPCQGQLALSPFRQPNLSTFWRKHPAMAGPVGAERATIAGRY